MDETGPSGTVASLTTKTISESAQVSSGEPQDVASSSGAVLELLTPGSAETPVSVTIPILSVIVPQVATELIDEDIVHRLITRPHAMIVEALLNQFFTYKNIVLPLLLQNTNTSECTVTGLKGLANDQLF